MRCAEERVKPAQSRSSQHGKMLHTVKADEAAALHAKETAGSHKLARNNGPPWIDEVGAAL